MIYRQLLISTNKGRIFTHPQNLLAASLLPPLITHQQRRSGIEGPGTHAALLRTCHRIYSEALPILYSENAFYFARAPDVEAFRWTGLSRHSCKKRFFPALAFSELITSVVDQESSMAKPLFGLQPDTHGRFSMVRHLILDFSGIGGCFTADHLKKDCKIVEEEWSGLLQQTIFTHSAYNICFPNLEILELKFHFSSTIRRLLYTDQRSFLRVSWQAVQISSLKSWVLISIDRSVHS